MKKKFLLRVLFIATTLLLCGMPMQAQEPYAVLSDNNTVLTFYYDNNKEERNGLSVGRFDKYNDQSWKDNNGTIETVVFDDSFTDCSTLTSTKYWFYGCSSL